jgi:hypothetical protein
VRRHHRDEAAHRPAEEGERPLDPLACARCDGLVVQHRGGRDVQAGLEVGGLELVPGQLPVVEDPRARARAVEGYDPQRLKCVV